MANQWRYKETQNPMTVTDGVNAGLTFEPGKVYDERVISPAYLHLFEQATGDGSSSKALKVTVIDEAADGDTQEEKDN